MSISLVMGMTFRYYEADQVSIPRSEMKNSSPDPFTFKREFGINESEFSIYTHLYDSDIREMKEGILMSFLYIQLFIKNFNSNKNIGTKDIQLIDVLRNKHYVIIEAIFKNGMRYAPDIRQKLFVPPYRNLGFTNIFNPTEEFVKGFIVPPLLFIYLLKILILEKGRKDIESIKKILENNITIGYRDSIINNVKNAFEHMSEYNYVAFEADSSESDVENIAITVKGRIVYNVIFRDIDVLHSNIYFATIYEDWNETFSVYEPSGYGYITRTLENVSKYLYFLENLQREMLRDDSILKINFITLPLKKRFQRLYYIEGKDIKSLNFSEEVSAWVQENFLSGFKECMDKIKTIVREDKFLDFIKRRVSNKTITFNEKVYLLMEWKYIQLNLTEVDDYMYLFTSNVNIKKYLNIFTENTERRLLESITEHILNVHKLDYLQGLCDSNSTDM